MKNLSHLFLATTLGAVLLGFPSPPLNAAGRVDGSAFDGSWSVAIYTLRGDCGSVRAAVDRRRTRLFRGPKLPSEWRCRR